MKHLHFDVETDGFYGAYWRCAASADHAVIAMLGDDPEDYMARSAVKWLLRLGVPLPYMPFCYQHPRYWQIIAEETKRTGDMIVSRKLFDDSEAAHPITEEETIKVENICGRLLLVCAEDDVLWDAAKYVRRMERRLAEKPHGCQVEVVVYRHGTHFVLPEGMLKTMLPVGSGLLVKWAFKEARRYPRECRETRLDIDRRMTRIITEWRDEA